MEEAGDRFIVVVVGESKTEGVVEVDEVGDPDNDMLSR
jgi:hypothetical protein